MNERKGDKEREVTLGLKRFREREREKEGRDSKRRGRF